MDKRSNRIVAALTAVALIPVWLFRYFPSQDGPSHLYNAYVLARIGHSPLVQQFFVINVRPFPNWTMYLLMAPLTLVLPPTFVQSVVISLCVLALVVCTVYVQLTFKGAVDATALLAVMLGYSSLLFLGFFNFILGAALFTLTVACWWRGKSMIGVYALLALTYFTHALPFAAAVLSIALLAAIGKRWRTLLLLVPAFVVLLLDAVARISAPRDYRSFGWHVGSLIDLRPLVFHGDADAWIARAAALALVVAIAATRKRNPMMWVTIGLLAGYFIAPWGYGAGGWTLGGWISDRLLFLVLLTLPAWIECRRPAVAVGIALVVAHLGAVVFEARRMEPRIEAMARAASFVRPHSTIQSLGGDAETFHAASYLALGQDIVNLDDYEARLRDFPIVFRPAAPRTAPDSLLVWRDAHVRNVRGYHPVFTTADARLFVRDGL